MNISNLSSSHFYIPPSRISDHIGSSQAENHEKTLNKKEGVIAHEQAQPQATAHSSSLVASNAEVNSNEDNKADLTKVSPKETYKLAVSLLENDQIPLSSYVLLMAIGLNQEYPPGESVDKVNPNTEPFNLLQEVEMISKGEHSTFTSGDDSDRESAGTLLDLLTSLHDKEDRTQYSKIDITV